MGTRYYTHGGLLVGLRVGGANPTWVAGDLHGTMSLAVDSSTDAVVRRSFDPYGNPLGVTTGGAWPDSHGFLDKPTVAATGLTDVGARKYDPVTGVFISPDPLLDPSDPGSLNGYSYADANPITNTDPTGQICMNGPDGSCHKSDGTNVQTHGVSGPGGLASGDGGADPGSVTVSVTIGGLDYRDNLAGDWVTVGGYQLPSDRPVRARLLVQTAASILGKIRPARRRYYSIPELLVYACDELPQDFCSYQFHKGLDFDASAQMTAGCDTPICRAVAAGGGFGLMSGGGSEETPEEAIPGYGAARGPNARTPGVQSLAHDLAKATGGKIKTNKDGYTIEVPYKRRGTIIRVMNATPDRSSYYRISVPGKQSLTVGGEPSSDRALTHIEISESTHEDVMRIIERIKDGS